MIISTQFLSFPISLNNDNIMASTDSFYLPYPKLEFISTFSPENMQSRKRESGKAKEFFNLENFFFF